MGWCLAAILPAMTTPRFYTSGNTDFGKQFYSLVVCTAWSEALHAFGWDIYHEVIALRLIIKLSCGLMERISNTRMVIHILVNYIQLHSPTHLPSKTIIANILIEVGFVYHNEHKNNYIVTHSQLNAAKVSPDLYYVSI